MSSNPAHSEVYSMQHYVIMCTVICGSFWPGSQVSSTNKTYRHDRAEILLKVSWNITISTPSPYFEILESWQMIQTFQYVYFIQFVCILNKLRREMFEYTIFIIRYLKSMDCQYNSQNKAKRQTIDAQIRQIRQHNPLQLG